MTYSISVNPLLFPCIRLNLGIYSSAQQGTKYELDIRENILRQSSSSLLNVAMLSYLASNITTYWNVGIAK
jgi:hypothetical protein